MVVETPIALPSPRGTASFNPSLARMVVETRTTLTQESMGISFNPSLLSRYQIGWFKRPHALYPASFDSRPTRTGGDDDLRLRIGTSEKPTETGNLAV